MPQTPWGWDRLDSFDHSFVKPAWNVTPTLVIAVQKNHARRRHL